MRLVNAAGTCLFSCARRTPRAFLSARTASVRSLSGLSGRARCGSPHSKAVRAPTGGFFPRAASSQLRPSSSPPGLRRLMSACGGGGGGRRGTSPCEASGWGRTGWRWCKQGHKRRSEAGLGGGGGFLLLFGQRCFPPPPAALCGCQE